MLHCTNQIREPEELYVSASRLDMVRGLLDLDVDFGDTTRPQTT